MRELHLNEIPQVSGGFGRMAGDPTEEPDTITVTGVRINDPWVTSIDGQSMAAQALREYFGQAWMNELNDALNASVNDIILTENDEGERAVTATVDADDDGDTDLVISYDDADNSTTVTFVGDDRSYTIDRGDNGTFFTVTQPF